MGLPSPRKDAHRPGGSRTRESSPSRSCPAAVTSWDAPPHPGSPKERKRREGLVPRHAADSAGRWAPLVDVPGPGVLPREPLHPGKLAQGRLPLPIAILTVASRLGLGPHSVVAFTPAAVRAEGHGCAGVGVGARLATLASWPGCGSHGSLTPGSDSPDPRPRLHRCHSPPLVLADLLAEPSSQRDLTRTQLLRLGARPPTTDHPGTMQWPGLETLHAPWDHWPCVSEGAMGLAQGCGWVAWGCSTAVCPSVRPGCSERAGGSGLAWPSGSVYW